MSFPERAARRLLATLDAAATRAYGHAWNPLYQSGTVAVAMLLVLIGTGLYLLLFYRLGAPAASVGRMAADPWLGAWIRSLHRYATDVFLLAAAVHALRMFAHGRSWGARALAWVSGLVLFGVGLLCAWTGFVMAWDSFGERLAREGGRLLDVLPVFSEPLSRIFAGDGPVPSAFFFVNMFIHIAVPLAMGAGLWLHVSHLARPALLPPRRVLWGIIGALVVAAVVIPAPLGAPANAFTLAPTTPTVPRAPVAGRGVERGAGPVCDCPAGAALRAPAAHRCAGAERRGPAALHRVQPVPAGLPVGSDHHGEARRRPSLARGTRRSGALRELRHLRRLLCTDGRRSGRTHGTRPARRASVRGADGVCARRPERRCA